MAGSTRSRPKFSAEWLLAGCLALSAAGGLAAAQGPLVAYKIVDDAIPASLTGKPGDPMQGRAILSDRRVGLCLLCHRGPVLEEKVQGSLAPDLAGVGTRLSAGQLRLRVVDASRVNPSTIMPPYYRTDGLNRVAPAYAEKPILTAGQVEDVVAFLATLKD